MLRFTRGGAAAESTEFTLLPPGRARAWERWTELGVVGNFDVGSVPLGGTRLADRVHDGQATQL
jgi:hypothetical protein